MRVSDTYRKAASILVLRPKSETEKVYELLLLHKPRKRDAWQLPQGGAEDDETAEQCALRELQEEAGISTAEVLGVSDLEYKYDFPASYRRFRPDHICGQKIAFVFGICPAGTEVTVDNVEVDAFQWIAPEDAPQILKRKEYLKLVQLLIAEAEEALRERDLL